MSQFYSDLLSWTTAGLACGAIFMNGVTLSPVRPKGGGDNGEILVASAGEITARAILRDVAARRGEAARPQPIPAARLEKVTFASLDGPNLREITRGLPRPVPAQGTVTGSSVNLRGGPGTGFPVVGRAVKGDSLRVTGMTDGSWVGILMPETEDPAWVHESLFEPPEG